MQMSDLGDALRCDDCGKFTSGEGATFASMFDFVAMCPDYDHCRCGACTERLGPVKSNARPHSGDTSPYEWSGDDLARLSH